MRCRNFREFGPWRSARWPISFLKCIPSNETFRTARSRRNCIGQSPRWQTAVTPRTRPPAVTSVPSGLAVPAWNSHHARRHLSGLELVIRLPVSIGAGIAAGGERRRRPPSRVVAARVCQAREPRMPQADAERSSARSPRIEGEDNLGFRIAEPAIVLHNLRARRRSASARHRGSRDMAAPRRPCPRAWGR